MKAKTMEVSLRVRLGVLAAMVALSVGTLHVLGGRPLWPPPKHSAEYRQANMLFLRFQDALAAERWQDALSLCSSRVQAKAAEWPAPKAFFNDTIPINLLLAQDFGYWMLRSGQPVKGDETPGDAAYFYGLFVPLTEPEATPVLQWYWAISATNRSWVVDYPPVRLEDYIARKKAAIQEREDKIKQIRQSLEPKVQGIKTHLAPVSQRFVLGSPMLFRVELTNLGQSPADYLESGVAFAPLTLLDDQRRPLPYTEVPAQIRVRKGNVAPAASVILADKIDLNQHYTITKPGKYVVQFSGAKLAIGQPVSAWTPGPFGESQTVSLAGPDFVAATNRFPSEPIEIEVKTGPRQ